MGSLFGSSSKACIQICYPMINSKFVEVNNFEKRDTYFIFCYCCNKCFSGTMAFLCSMDVSMV